MTSELLDVVYNSILDGQMGKTPKNVQVALDADIAPAKILNVERHFAMLLIVLMNFL